MIFRLLLRTCVALGFVRAALNWPIKPSNRVYGNTFLTRPGIRFTSGHNTIVGGNHFV